MNYGRTIFAQIMDYLPTYEFRQCVERYTGNYKVKSFSCWDQFLSMAFAQLTYRESLRKARQVYANDSYRPLSFAFPVGNVSQEQGGGEITRSSRSESQHLSPSLPPGKFTKPTFSTNCR